MTFNCVILLLFLCYLVQGEYNSYPDISKISYGLSSSMQSVKIQFTVDISGYDSKIECNNCISNVGLTIKCNLGVLVNVVITLSASNKQYFVPFNVSCIVTSDRAAIENLTSTPNIHSLQLSWITYDTSINKYIIYYINGTNYHHETITANGQSYSLDNLSEKTLYRVCLAPVNARLQNGQYTCIMNRTDFSETGPVTDAKVSSTEDSVSVSWKKPKYKYDIPNGYKVMYRDQSGNCGLTIITVDSSSISDKESCTNKGSIQWTSLGELQIPSLSPYTQYTITISPVNNNKIQIVTKLTTTTKEGESGPVSNLRSSIIKRYLRIQYYAPSKPNGVIKLYRIRFVLTRQRICTQINDIRYEHNTTTDYHDMSLDKLIKCSEYRIEVTPINGWSRNGGLGQTSSILFEYKPDDRLTITNMGAKFVSSNIAQVSWIHPSIKDECDNIGFMVTVSNKDRPSECHMQILSNENCTKLYDIIERAHECKDRVLKKYDNSASSWITNIGGSFTQSSNYHISLWKITHKEILQSQPILIAGTDKDCSTDCWAKEYSGIRSAQYCTSWKLSGRYPNMFPNSLHSFCTMKGGTKPWCATINYYKYCNIPKCDDITLISGCVRNIDVIYSSSTITIQWMEPDYRGTIIGYITLLFNTDHQCQRSHIQLCDTCPYERDLDEQIRNFYVSCPSNIIETRTITKKSLFDNLHQNKEYIVYIIPVLSRSNVGEVKKSSVRTAVAKPDPPINIIIKHRTISSLQFGWDHSSDFTFKGEPENYSAMLISNNGAEQSVTVSSTNVKFTSLNMCTEYCLRLSANNIAGSSQMSAITCHYTLAPNLGDVSVDDIASGSYLNIIISWIYYEINNCYKYYKLEIRNKFGREIIHKSTNSTLMVINKLSPNLNYTVRVRAETTLDTENNQKDGPYSHIKEFYSGILKPPVYQYREYIDLSRRILNISWSFNISQEGSIFEIFVIIKNSSIPCLTLTHLTCSSCPDPYNVRNFSDSNQVAREKLLKCPGEINKKIFDKETFVFNIQFIMEKPLKNYSVDIYAVNLVGLQKIHGSNSSHADKAPLKSGASIGITIFLLMVLLLVVIVVLVKVKRRPRFIYDIITKSSTKPNGNISKQEYTASKTRLIETSAISPGTASNARVASIVPRSSSNNIPEIQLPMLEPKRKGSGIPLKEFPAYYEKMAAKDNDLIIQEYKKLTAECKKLEKQLGLTVDTGKLPANAKKNRFINILPFDQTRVIIQGKTNKNDYINANYIPFLTEKDAIEYIASQGPIDQSIDDFWQMIMNENINCVVMLTRTMEDDKFKCLQYWPDNFGEEQTYGHNGEITVILEEEVELESHIERNFLVKNETDKSERKIVQLHMHTWSDHSAPNLEYFDKLLFRFHEIINNVANNPYLIHCSAGVGRTGTLMCIDRIIKQLVNGCQEINIYDAVFTLRHYRNFMVQRQAQYIFIHDYIDHFLKKYMKIDDVEETMYFNEE